MARTNLATASIHNLDRDTGTDITAVAGDTMTAGAGDGLIIPYKTNNVLVLRNGTGFAATVTIKVVNPSQAEAVNLAVADKTLSIADGDTILYPLSAIFRQTDDEVWVDCDQAIEVAVISL